jgi:hypothetical protein
MHQHLHFDLNDVRELNSTTAAPFCFVALCILHSQSSRSYNVCRQLLGGGGGGVPLDVRQNLFCFYFILFFFSIWKSIALIRESPQRCSDMALAPLTIHLSSRFQLQGILGGGGQAGIGDAINNLLQQVPSPSLPPSHCAHSSKPNLKSVISTLLIFILTLHPPLPAQSAVRRILWRTACRPERHRRPSARVHTPFSQHTSFPRFPIPYRITAASCLLLDHTHFPDFWLTITPQQHHHRPRR